LQNLLRRLPEKDGKNAVSNESEEELDFDKNFAGMILCTHAGVNRTEWILDYGASDHMTYAFDHLVESKTLKEKSKITLPNGHTSEISSVGKIKLSNELILQDVLYVPVFEYNLLSIPKLTKDSNYIISFSSQILCNKGLCQQEDFGDW